MRCPACGYELCATAPDSPCPECGLDAKGRVSLPSDFRDVLEAHGARDRFVLVPASDGVEAHIAFSVAGHERLVDALSADAFVIIARGGGAPGERDGLSAFLVPADATGLAVTRSDMVDSRQYGSLAFDDLQLPASALMGTAGEAWPGLERCLDIAAIGFAAELLGLSLEAFERTMAYLRERKQFGRVIGSFQGLQHRAAMLFAELELARSIVLEALHAIDDDSDDLSRLASAAKAKLCEVAQLASNEGIQMHGGIGMTDEYDIGFFLKRARVLQHLAGDAYYHLDRFARLGGF